MHSLLEVEMCGQRRQVVSVMIHVMAATRLGGTSMSAPVVGYDAIAVLEDEQHLRVPIIGRQRPAVAKHDGLTFAPVLVVDLRPIFRRNCRHVMFSFAWFPLKASSDLRTQIPAVYCTLKDQCCPFRLHRADDNFLETRPSERKMR